MALATKKFLNVETRKVKRRYRNREHMVLDYHNNLAITLSPEIADRFSLVPGLDCCRQEINGEVVILKFYRKGEPSI